MNNQKVVILNIDYDGCFGGIAKETQAIVKLVNKFYPDFNYIKKQCSFENVVWNYIQKIYLEWSAAPHFTTGLIGIEPCSSSA